MKTRVLIKGERSCHRRGQRRGRSYVLFAERGAEGGFGDSMEMCSEGYGLRC